MAITTLTDEDIGRLANFPAAISSEEVDLMEEGASSQERGVQRRLCLMACSSTSEKLSELFRESPEVFNEALDLITAFHEHTKGLAEVAEAAYFRMLAVGANCETPRG